MVDAWSDPAVDLAVASLAFAGFLLVHAVLWRRLGAERAGFALMVGLWSVSVAGALAAAVWLAVPVRVLTVLALDGALMAFYLHFYTGMLRSVSLRLLGELDAAGGRLGAEALAEIYSPASLRARLDWLVGRGWVQEKNETYRLTREGERFLARRHALAKLLVEGPTG